MSTRANALPSGEKILADKSAKDHFAQRFFDGWDLGVIVVVGGLVMIGLIGVYSSSISYAAEKLGDHSRFLVRQGLFVVIGIALGGLVATIPLSVWRRCAAFSLIGALLLLVLVLLPGIGMEVNGSARWIRLGGFNLQPSEIAKLLFLVYVAAYLSDLPEGAEQTFADLIQPLVLLAVFCFLMMLEPDFGTVAVMAVATAGVMWLGGVRMRYLFALGIACAGLLAYLSTSSSYRMARLSSFLNPWADPFHHGFQLTQALIAFGRGGPFGVGLGGSVQKLFYLPEAHTDFLLAVIAEELGLGAVLLVLALFMGLVAKGFAIAKTAFQRGEAFAANLAYGISLLFGLQAFVNIGVNMGALPTKGLTLPFISYGGSSMVMSCICIAVLLRVDHENRAAAF